LFQRRIGAPAGIIAAGMAGNQMARQDMPSQQSNLLGVWANSAGALMNWPLL
jgi:hypothetical protein